MKKHHLAGFILLALPALVFSNNTNSFFVKSNFHVSQNAVTETSNNVKISEPQLLEEGNTSHKKTKETELFEVTIPTDTVPPPVVEEEIPDSDEFPISSKTTAPNSSESSDGNGKSNSKAEKLYNNLGYLASVDQLLKKEEKENLSADEKFKLANSYRLNSMTEDAEYWYAQVIRENSKPEHILHYAEMLQSNGKCEDAVRWFKVYNVSDDSNREVLEDCAELERIPELEGVTVTNMENLNTTSLDFSPILYEDGMVISSTRGSAQKIRRKDKWTKDKFSDLFFTKKENEEFSKPKAIASLNEKFHDGTATFNKQGDYVVFSRNSNKGKSSKGIKELKLYEAKKVDGKWTKVKSLNINNNEFSTCHPTLSLNGKRLYFSSNRPDSYGEMDIYVSHKISGKWTEPQNLGPIVNSAGNEVFPTIDDNENLYYSSSGHAGVGGLDLFVAEKTDDADETSWSIRQNMGKPFNSPKDDMGYVIEKENESGYFVSNRKGGKGKDDIYRWEMSEETVVKTKKQKLEKEFCVYDIQNNERLEGVRVGILKGNLDDAKKDLTLTLKPLDANESEFVLGIKKEDEIVRPNKIATSDEKGKFQYLMESDEDYFFVLSKKGYGKVQHQTDLTKVMRRSEYCIAMAPQSCVMMKGEVKNKGFDRPIPFAEVNMFNRCTGETLKARADEHGKFEFCVDCDCEFEILASKDRFKQGEIIYSTTDGNCKSDVMKYAIVELDLLDRKEWEASQNIPSPQYINNPHQNHSYGTNPNAPVSSNPTMDPNNYVTKEYLLEYFTGNPNHDLKVGETFTLKNIYYDFDKYNIRSDASTELNHIASLMKMKPSMEISMASHTDTRGRDSYNHRLSQKRAIAAKVHLISQGISPNRVHGVLGMGETQPIINCSDCSEEDHQLNRRTEITIIKL